MLKSISERIKKAIEESNLSYQQLEGITGIKRSTLNRYAIGQTTKVPMNCIEAIAKATGVSAAYLMGWQPQTIELDNNNIHRIPILGSIRCGEPAYAEEEFIGYVDSTTRCDFALRAVGDSMTGARIHDGDIVFIRKQPTVENGQIAAVAIDDEATLKRVYLIPNGFMMLQAENPKYAPIMVNLSDETQNVRILGLAVAFQGKII